MTSLKQPKFDKNYEAHLSLWSNRHWQQDLLWLAIFNYNNITRKLGETLDVLRLFLKISYDDFRIILVPQLL